MFSVSATAEYEIQILTQDQVLCIFEIMFSHDSRPELKSYTLLWWRLRRTITQLLCAKFSFFVLYH